MITYNQECLIKRAIDSLLTQKEYIYEICISDDCSQDRTWDVLQDYYNNYPGLFKISRNVENIGIFENIERSWQMPCGDIVYFLSGDDECGKDWFKSVIKFIEENGINYVSDKFAVYGDYKAIYPNGDSCIFSNKIKQRESYAFKAALRGMISNRSCCFSINVLRQFNPVSQGRSHIAEDAQDRQLQIFCPNNYYIPMVGNIYYSGIGVSSGISPIVHNERLKSQEYAISTFELWGIVIDKKDKYYATVCFPAREKMLYKKSILNLLRWVYYSIRGKERGINVFNGKYCLFALMRRFPHCHPINY